MSHAAITWALGQQILRRSSDRFLLTCLANYADESGNSYPSQAKLILDTRLDRKTVISGLSRLIDDGLILDTGLRVGGTKQVIVYRLLGVNRAPMTHYTYRTTCAETGEFYIGKRSYDGDPQDDGRYRGSSKWVADAEREGRVLVKQILQVFDTAKEALVREQELFREFETNPLCQNQGTPLAKRRQQLNALASTEQSRNSPVFPNGERSHNSQTVPILPANGPKNGTRNLSLVVPETSTGENQPLGDSAIEKSIATQDDLFPRSQPVIVNKGVQVALLTKQPKSKPRRALGDWSPGEHEIAWAMDRGLTSEEARYQVPKFINHHLSKGTLSADWPANWRTWVMNKIEWAAQDRAKAAPQEQRLAW